MDETVVLPCICKPLLEQKGRRAHQSGGSKGGNQGLGTGLLCRKFSAGYQRPPLVENRRRTRANGYLLAIGRGTRVLVAWRNSTRCIGRLHWHNLVVRDRRALRSAEESFLALIEHVRLSTGSGKVVPMITIFALEHSDQRPVRIWNRRLIDYAGYRRSDGSILGDPLNVRFSEVVANWAGFATRQAPSKM
jgi:hypothetical protein